LAIDIEKICSKKIAEKLFKDYWLKQDAKYVYNVDELINVYNLPITIRKIFRYYNLYNIVKTEEGIRRIKTSRSSFIEAHPDDLKERDRRMAEEAKKVHKKEIESRKKKNKEIKSILVSCSIDDFDEQEIKLIAVFKKYWKELFVDGSLSFNQISFKLHTSPKKAEAVFLKVLAKGGLDYEIDVNTDERSLTCVNSKFNKYLVSKSDQLLVNTNIKNIIPSEPAKKLFNKLHNLHNLYAYVFPEITPVTIFDLSAAKEIMNPQEAKWFFLLRYDFVCTDEDFRPIKCFDLLTRYLLNFELTQVNERSSVFTSIS